jgi:hypothetical protein
VAAFIPVALEGELQRIKKAIAGRPFVIIFDETSFDGEAICLVARFWSGWEMRHECVLLELVDKSTSGLELAQVLVTTILTRLSSLPTPPSLSRPAATCAARTALHFAH